jgi:hypothetical protein
MTGFERLKIVQDRLIAMGVRDVKFTWAPDVHKSDPDVLAGQVADFLQGFVDGRYIVVKRIDAPERTDGDGDGS